MVSVGLEEVDLSAKWFHQRGLGGGSRPDMMSHVSTPPELAGASRSSYLLRGLCVVRPVRIVLSTVRFSSAC